MIITVIKKEECMQWWRFHCIDSEFEDRIRNVYQILYGRNSTKWTLLIKHTHFPFRFRVRLCQSNDSLDWLSRWLVVRGFSLNLIGQFLTGGNTCCRHLGFSVNLTQTFVVARHLHHSEMSGTPLIVLSEYSYFSLLFAIPYLRTWRFLFLIDQNTRRESGRKVQLGNVEAAKVRFRSQIKLTRHGRTLTLLRNWKTWLRSNLYRHEYNRSYMSMVTLDAEFVHCSFLLAFLKKATLVMLLCNLDRCLS